jgi:hypothetical protein
MGEADLRPIRWSPHAEERLAAREVEETDVHLTIVDPEFVVQGVPPRRIHMRRFVNADSGKAMLLRVIIEETPIELVVLTVYRTTKVRKYLRGLV